jgi:molecular chaperone GrpE
VGTKGKMIGMSETENLEQNAPETENNPPVDEQVDGELNSIPDLVQKITAERDQYHEQMLRTMADFQNFRKRSQQEQQIRQQYATESVVLSLLPVMDNFERTVSSAEQGAQLESLVTGVKAVEKQLRYIIEQQGVTRIQAVGQLFDANLHEALSTVTTDEHAADTVVDEIEPGYKMGDKVIRPAKVRVSVKP